MSDLHMFVVVFKYHFGLYYEIIIQYIFVKNQTNLHTDMSFHSDTLSGQYLIFLLCIE